MMFSQFRALLDAHRHPSRWIVFLLLFVFVRGMLVLCVFPAFEGWDEVQHLAYIDYVDRNGTPPVLGVSCMNEEFMRSAAEIPQSDAAVKAVSGYGARTFSEYWNRLPVTHADGLPHMIYEAQHPPLYYFLMAPVYRMLGGTRNLLVIVFVLRVINLVMTVAAIGVCMLTFRLLLTRSIAWKWASALLAVHPLFLLNGERVANDAMSVLEAAAILYLLARFICELWRGRAPSWGLPCCTAVLLGVSIWTKPTALALVPVVFLVPLVVGWMKCRGGGLRRVVVCVMLMAAIVAGIVGPLFVHNFSLYHSMVPIAESLLKQPDAPISTFSAATAIDWVAELRFFWLSGSLWTGGWSFLEPLLRVRKYVFEPLLVIGMVLFFWNWAQSREKRALNPESMGRSEAGLCVGVIVSFTLAMAGHAIQTYVILGNPATCPWYAAAAWPLELLMVASGFALLRRRWVGKALCILLLSGCLIVEFHGTLFRMSRAYTGIGLGMKSLQRLAIIRPGIFGTPTLIALAIAYVVMGVILLMTIVATREGSLEVSSGKAGSAVF